MKKSKNVLKKSGLFLLLALAIVLIVRCEKDSPVVVPAKYTVDISAGVGGTVDPSGKIEVIKGKEFNITFTPNPGYKIDTVFVNGVEFPLTNNVYPFVASSSSKVEGVFKKTLSWYAMQGAWNLDSALVKQNDGTWAYMIINSRDSVLFFPTGGYKTYRDGKLIGGGVGSYWSINELTNPPTFNYGGYVSNIGKLDDNELIMETEDIIDKYSHH